MVQQCTTYLPLELEPPAGHDIDDLTELAKDTAAVENRQPVHQPSHTKAWDSQRQQHRGRDGRREGARESRVKR